MKLKSLLLGLSFLTLSHALQSVELPDKRADMIVFSYDRPLQLDGLLRSIELYMTGLGTLQVVYRTSSSEYDRAYDVCFKQHSGLSLALKKQGDNPREDFKRLTLQALAESPHEYVLFAVDDIVVKDYVNLNECIKYLDLTGAYGFYLRLGEHITESYAARVPERIPPYKIIKEDVRLWRFADAPFSVEWHYPNTVDMTVYKRSDVVGVLEVLPFYSPNTLEGSWAASAEKYGHYSKSGLFYRESKVVNIPFNLVQNDWVGSHNMGKSKDEFLKLFDDGYRLDVARYFRLIGNAPHVEAPLYLMNDISKRVKEDL